MADDRDVMFHCRMTSDERGMLEELAKNRNVSASDYVREMIRSAHQGLAQEGPSLATLGALWGAVEGEQTAYANIVLAWMRAPTARPPFPNALLAAIDQLYAWAWRFEEPEVYAAIKDYRETLDTLGWSDEGRRPPSEALAAAFSGLDRQVRAWKARLTKKGRKTA